MHLKIQVTVSADDGSVSETTANELRLATAAYGTDENVAKQDFLTQAESLLRTVSENQLPALYETVRQRCSEACEETPAQANVRKKLDKLRAHTNGDASGEVLDAGESAQ